jgi:PhzF family phenazine biosynthesis protein
MRQWTVDAFAAAPFKGNQACVLEPFDAWPAAGWMQALAQENNQAETAYLLKTDDPARFGLRWFTPTLEMPLCGHATLAAGHVLFTEAGLDASAVTFDTQSGALMVACEGERYSMDFPSNPPKRTPTPAGLAEALGVEPQEVWAGAYLLAVLKDESQVRALNPDIAAIKTIVGDATGGRGNLVVCALADRESPVAGRDYDVVDRFFAPGSGIPEDAATGSAHCILAPLYADKLGRAKVRFYQAYPGRGAEIQTELRGDRVILSGQAITVIESRLRL